MRSVAELRAEIEAAWADAVYPGDPEVYAGWENEKWIEEEMLGKHWRDIDPEFAVRFARGDNLQVTEPAALVFYVPAFMIADLAHGGMPLVNVLAPPWAAVRDEPHIQWFHARVDLLTDPQRLAISQYFAYARQKGWLTDSDWALVVEYYGRYLGTLAEELADID